MISKTASFSLMFTALLFTAILVIGCNTERRVNTSGWSLYTAKCSSCHMPIPPERFEKATLNYYVEKYGRHLTDNERRNILEYLKNGS